VSVALKGCDPTTLQFYIERRNELYGIQHSHGGRSVVFGGGVPIRLNGVTIGAVGVSGGSLQQDAEIGGAAAACTVGISSE
jgi:uncharacterized protein GlcG (DUF336 family)